MGTETFRNGTDAPNMMDALQKHIPFRVVILDKNGSMGELWLPGTPEGCGIFDSTGTGKSDYPVTLRAINGRWVAVCDEGAFFVQQGQPAGKNAEIQDHQLLEVNAAGRRLVLYTEAEKEEDNRFIPYYLEHAAIRIGRLGDNDICYESHLVSRYHAALVWENDSWWIRDMHSTNGVYLNQKAVRTPGPLDNTGKPAYSQEKVKPGDSIYIMGLRLIMGVGYVSINNGGNRIRITSPLLHEIVSEQGVKFAEKINGQTEETYFNRLPRKRNMLAPDPIVIESPPPSLSDKMPLLLRMGTPLMSGARAVISGNILSAAMSMLMPLATQGFSEKERKDYEALRKEKYGEYLVQKQQEIDKEIEFEEKTLKHDYPSVDGVLSFVVDQTRLWERQKNDADFLSIRVGHGDMPMLAEKQYDKERFELTSDPLHDEMMKLGKAPSTLKDVPVMLDLKEDRVAGILAPRSDMLRLMRNLIIQLVMNHSYDEVKIVLLCGDDSDGILSLVPYLPHFWSDDRSQRYVVQDTSDAQQLSRTLNEVYEEYSVEGSKRKRVLKTKPAYVILACDKDLFESVEVLKNIALADDYRGFSIITGFDELLKESTCVLDLKQGGGKMDLIHPEVPDQPFTPDLCTETKMENCLSKLMHTKLKMEEAQYVLPNMITFLDMYNVTKVEDLNPLKRWNSNNPVKSISAPIGVGTDGKLFSLDLHEKKQGPHGLVAGMTGSGKSEFIITYILSMAVNYSPDEVAFVLIDYKGGGLADAFVDKKRGIHLPHVVGTITNLDGAGISRSLLSIESELKRRQALFSKAKSETGEGTMDIYDYQRLYRQKRVSEPLPHLIIVSDEFAELKKQQPEFMNQLISTARIGRSLGVHLILATQKPSGVVNDQIWSNTKFRVCLKVQDRSDSNEMLKRPEAAELKNVGRFYLQVGYNELFALGQSAWCGAGYEPTEEKKQKDVDNTAQFLDNTGQVILNAQPVTQKKKAEKKQIVAIVQYLSDLARAEGITARMLWKEPLPARMELAEKLDEAWQNEDEKKQMLAVIGMTDDPQHQRQELFTIDMLSFHNMLMVGPSGSGKSTFLRTMLFSLVSHYSPEELNYYIVDLSGGSLNPFRNAPHCGAYLNANDEADFDRLTAMIKEIVQERKEEFARAGVSNYDAYLQIGRMPLILFVIDSFFNINANFARGGDIYSNFHLLLAETASYGVRIILTVNHGNEVSTKSKQELDYRICLSPKDKYEAADILGVKVGGAPAKTPGRGLCVVGGRSMEYQVAKLHCMEKERSAVSIMQDELDLIVQKYGTTSEVRKLPVLNGGQTYEEFCSKVELGRIPLGYHTKDMAPIMLPLKQLTCLPIYLGNPYGARPVISNLLYAANLNNIEVLIVKRDDQSVFDSQNNLLADYPGDATLYYCKEEDITNLALRLNEEVSNRNKLVFEYCDMKGIPENERKARKATGYIMEHAKPLLVLFESFREFCKLKKSQTADAVFNTFLGNLKGYGIYFAGCLYPEDQKLMSTDMMMNRFAADVPLLLFGGKYNQQCLAQMIPPEIRRQEKVNESYDMGYLRYRDGWYSIQMPCGTIEPPKLDPDDAPIV